MSASYNDPALNGGIIGPRETKYMFEERGLSRRESEVAELVAQGKSNKDIATELFVTEKTVKFHNTNIFKKLSVKSRAQLIVAVTRHRAEKSTTAEVSP